MQCIARAPSIWPDLKWNHTIPAPRSWFLIHRCLTFFDNKSASIYRGAYISKISLCFKDWEKNISANITVLKYTWSSLRKSKCTEMIRSDTPLPWHRQCFNWIWKLAYHMYYMQRVQVSYNQVHEQMKSVERNDAMLENSLYENNVFCNCVGKIIK